MCWLNIFIIATSRAFTYGADSTETGSLTMQKTADNGYIMVGFTESFLPNTYGEDGLLIKADSAGNLQWSKYYREVGADPDDQLHFDCVQQTSDNGYVVCGSYVPWSGPSDDIIVMKVDANGDVEWAKTCDLIEGGSNKRELGYYVGQLSDNSYVVGGSTSWGPGTPAVFFKLDASGNVDWVKTYAISWNGNDKNATIQTIHPIAGGYILGVDAFYFSSPAYDTPGSEYMAIKTDANGGIIWKKQYGDGSSAGTGDNFCELQKTSDGGYIMIGTSNSFTSDYNLMIIKIDGAGNQTWAYEYGGPLDDFIWEYFPGYSTHNCIQQLADDSYIVTGRLDTDTKGGQALIFKLASSGNILWAKSFGDVNWEGGHSVQQASDGGFAIGGGTNGFGAGETDFMLVKVESDGSMTDPDCPIEDYALVKTDVSPADYDSIVTEGTPSGAEINVNDITLSATDADLTRTDICGAMGVEEPNYKLQITNCKLQISPNPFTQRTVIRFQISDFRYQNPDIRHPTSDISLKIYDLSGRLVKTLTPNPPEADLSLTTAVEWDGKDDDGKSVPSGNYYCELKFDGHKTRKIIVVR